MTKNQRIFISTILIIIPPFAVLGAETLSPTPTTLPEVSKTESKAEPKASENPNRKQISGIVRIIRANPMTEVFFKDLKDSVIIPQDSKHNQIYEACEVSRKKGTPVQLVIDPVSRRVVSLPEDKSKVGEVKSEASPESSSSKAETAQ